MSSAVVGSTAVSSAASWRFLAGAVAVAAVWRAFVAILTGMPSEDGVSYLWMAERFRAGDACRALGEVFPPLLPLMTAPLLALGLDPFRAGQLCGVAAGALAVPVLARIAEHAAPRSGRAAAWFAVFAHWPTRSAAEVYTEAEFHLVAGLALLWGLRGRALGCGLAAGLACWLRPEAALVPLAFAVLDPRRKALPAAVGLAVPLVLLGAWRASCGHGFVPIAKLAFNWERLWPDGVTPAELVGHVGLNLLAAPWLLIEAFGVPVLLAAWVAFRVRDRRLAPLWIVLALGVLVVAAFLPRRRLLVSWWIAVLPLAAAGFARLPPPGRIPVLVLTVVTGLLLGLRVQDADRVGERAVGEYLATRLAPGERVAGDMTRVVYYSGGQPLPPRHFTADELVEMARAPGVVFVVLGSGRNTTGLVTERLAGEFAPFDLPYDQEHMAEERGIVVLRRR